MRSTPFRFLLVSLACSAWSVVAGLYFSLLQQVQATITEAFPYYSLIGQGPLLGLCNPTCATTATDNRNAASYSYKLLVIGEPFFCWLLLLRLASTYCATCAACRVDSSSSSRSLVAPAPAPPIVNYFQQFPANLLQTAESPARVSKGALIYSYS